MTQLTPHFSLGEMTESAWAIRHKVDNTPTQEAEDNLLRLCVDLLEPIRVRLGRPIIVNSGYRSPRVNRGVGGAVDSAHLTGRAADITTVGMKPKELIRWIRNAGFVPDKAIIEFPQSANGGWVHIQIAKPGQLARNQWLLTDDGDRYEVMA